MSAGHSCAPRGNRLTTRSSLSPQGTEIYDAKRGALVDLGILDVMQIFGRAGRPQFDKYGEGTIITTHDKLSHYLTLLTQQNPIESQFLGSLPDNLNAEVRIQLHRGASVDLGLGVRWETETWPDLEARRVGGQGHRGS